MSRTAKIVIAAVAAVVVLGGAGLWWFLQDDAPPEVSLESALDSVEDDGTDTSTDDGGEPAGIEGTWTVDADTGSFDFESATGTFAGFRVEEELSTIGSATAVGRTGDVSGSITIEGTTLTAADVEVDLSTITTNESRRDNRAKAALEVDQFPIASFSLTDPVDLGADPTSGPVSVTAVGELTIHGVTLPAELAIEAQLEGDTIVLVGSTDIAFSDFGVEAPSAPIVLSISDTATIEVQLLLTKG